MLQSLNKVLHGSKTVNIYIYIIYIYIYIYIYNGNFEVLVDSGEFLIEEINFEVFNYVFYRIIIIIIVTN